MRRLLLLGMLSASLLFLGGSCDDECGDIFFDCDCEYPDPPSHGFLTLELFWDGATPIPVEIYEGKDIENGHFLFADTLELAVVDYLMPPGKYAAIARYVSGRDTILAVDGDEIEVNKDGDSCCECYQVKDATLELRLLR